jgi:hypothetical protein
VTGSVTPPNVIRAALALVAAAAVAAACGVANPFSPAAAAASRQDQLVKFAQCMRQHGVNMSDPVNGRITVQGNGGGGNSSADQPTQGNAQFQAAQTACKQYEPNGGKGFGNPNPQQLDQLTQFAQCMRQHGIPMNDPQVSGGAVQISVSPGPNGQRPDPTQMQQAQQACQKYLPGGGQNRSNG